VRLGHGRQRLHAVEVRLDDGVLGDVHADVGAPAEHDVQVAVGDGELVTHQEFLAVQHVLGDVLELLVKLVNLGLLVLRAELTKEGSEVGMHLRSDVVESDLGQVSVAGAIISSNRSGSLYIF
jgi:hypothetical protein